MGIKEISYTVSAAGLEPKTKQFCGVQGDHNVYQLKFTIDTELWNALKDKAAQEDGTLYYHFELHNGEGASGDTEPQRLESTEIILSVEEWLTRFGGVGKAVLVITLSKDDVTHLELYSFPALLQFANRPTRTAYGEGGYTSLATFAIQAKESAEAAEKASLKAQIASDNASAVNVTIQKGMKIKVDGKRSKVSASIWDTVLGEITETGEWPVSSAVIYAALEEIKTQIANMENNAVARAKLEAHPVGSLYWSKYPDSPAELFGGNWEPITDTFIIAAGVKYTIGSSGGKEEVTLTADNIAQHKHVGLNYSNNNVPVNIKRDTSDELKGVALQRLTNTAIYAPSDLTTGFNVYENGQKPIRIMPPYVAYYCWIRTEDKED